MSKKRPEKESTYFQDQKREKRQRHNPGFYTRFVKGLVSRSGHHEDRTEDKILPHPQKEKKTRAKCLQKANKKKTAPISEEYSEFSLLPLPECEIKTTECSFSSNPVSENLREISKSAISMRNDVDSNSLTSKKDFACSSVLKSSNSRIQGHSKEQRKQKSSSVTSNTRRNVVSYDILNKDMKYVTKGRKHFVSAGSTCNIATVASKTCEWWRGQHPSGEDDKLKHTGIQCDMSSLQEDNAEDTSGFDSNGNGVTNVNDILTSDRAEQVVNARCNNLDVLHNDKTFQTVSATMEEDIVSLPGMKDFLLRELPLQMNVLVQKHKERVVITGSIEQLNSIWTILSKKKQEHYTKENKVCEGKEKAFTEMVCDTDCSSLRSLDVSCRTSDKDRMAQSSQTGQRVVFVEDGHGISLQVNVEVPVSQLSSSANITSPQPSQNCMALSSVPVSSMNVNRNSDDEDCQKSVFVVSDIQESSPEGEILVLEEKDGAGSASEETSDLLQFSISDEALLSQPENNTDFMTSSQKAGKNYMVGTVHSLERVSEEQTVIVDGENAVSTILEEENMVDSSNSDTGPVVRLTDPRMSPLSSGGFLPSSRTLQCGRCNTMCQSEELALKHMKTVHKNGTLNTCEVCGVAFPDKRRLLVHLKAKHEGSGCTCQICGKKFQFPRYLRTHLQRHAGVKSFTCTICGWRFFEQNKLKFHMETHKTAEERNLPFKCNLCNKQFVNKATYSDHCNTHSGLRPFNCHVCSAAFGHRVGLRRHLKTVHEKARPYACSYCHKEFTYKAKLDSHLILHTGISKHRCELCGKVFTARTSLQRHRAKCSLGLKTTPLVQGTSPASQPDGEGDAVFLCGICDKAFANYEEAEQHIVLHDSRASSSSDEPVQEEYANTKDSEASHFLQSITVSQSVEAEVANAVCYDASSASGVVTDQLAPKTSLEHSMTGGRGEPSALRTHQGCTLKSLNEEEQVQLVASTLADLSTLC